MLKLGVCGPDGLVDCVLLSPSDDPPRGVKTSCVQVRRSKLHKAIKLAVEENTKAAHCDDIPQSAKVCNGWKADADGSFGLGSGEVL